MQTGLELAMSVIVSVVILGAYLSDLVRRLNGETNQFVGSVDDTVNRQNEILRALGNDMALIREAFPGISMTSLPITGPDDTFFSP